MASENLTMELWEIIQNNNQEEISYNDFEKELNNAFNLPKDDVDRALSIMIFQAEVNPNVIGEYKGGSFLISQSFTATVINTIKYENQFIPGKQEYIARESNIRVGEELINFVIITPTLISQMLDNFENLSSREISELAGSFYKMSDEDKDRFIDAQRQKIQKDKATVGSKDAQQAFDEIESAFDVNTKIHQDMKNGTIDNETRESYKVEILKNPGFLQYYFNITGKIFDEETELSDAVLNLWLSFVYKSLEEMSDINLFLDKAKKALESGDLEEFSKLFIDNPELGEQYLVELEKAATLLGYNLDEIFGFAPNLASEQDFKGSTGASYGITPKSYNGFERSSGKISASINGDVAEIDNVTERKDEISSGDEPLKASQLRKYISEFYLLNNERARELRIPNIRRHTVNTRVLKLINDQVKVTGFYSDEQKTYLDTTVRIKAVEAQKYKSTMPFVEQEVSEGETKIEGEDLDSTFDLFEIETGEEERDQEQYENQIKENSQGSKKLEKTLIEGVRQIDHAVPVKMKKDVSTLTSFHEYKDLGSIQHDDKIPQSHIDPYYKAYAEELLFAGEQDKRIPKKNPTGDRILKDVSEIQALGETIKGVRARVTASKIVSVLRLIGSVRSGDVRDAQQAVTSLTKVGKNFEEATQTADEVEQGE